VELGDGGEARAIVDEPFLGAQLDIHLDPWSSVSRW
jgi:hypothetical protein